MVREDGIIKHLTTVRWTLKSDYLVTEWPGIAHRAIGYVLRKKKKSFCKVCAHLWTGGTEK